MKLKRSLLPLFLLPVKLFEAPLIPLEPTRRLLVFRLRFQLFFQLELLRFELARLVKILLLLGRRRGLAGRLGERAFELALVLVVNFFLRRRVRQLLCQPLQRALRRGEILPLQRRPSLLAERRPRELLARLPQPPPGLVPRRGIAVRAQKRPVFELGQLIEHLLAGELAAIELVE